MESKKVISLVAALVVSAGLLTGCGSKDVPVVDNTSAVVTTEPVISVSGNYNKIDGFEKQPEEKVFEAGEHLFMKRYHLRDEANLNVQSLSGVSITVPEGYEVLDFENYISLAGKIGTQQTYGVDVWFINNEDVVVKPVYNEATRMYDYSQAGTVIEKEVIEEYVPSK